MRELHPVQLRETHQTRNATAWGQIRTRAKRHTGFDIPSDGGTTQLARPWSDSATVSDQAANDSYSA